jgi:exopolyphosphatase/guanosine-5'-triphosphate,3'-diphosphate pyrophosphatase
MRYAAIDIGSNAVRLLIKEIRVDSEGIHSDKVAYTRLPIRLGEDVFESGKIGKEKGRQLTTAMKAFRLLMKAMRVDAWRACATSAMREATNAQEVVARVREEANVDIEVIDGEEEADLIFLNFSISVLDRNQDYLYVDVGGGSTELTLIRQGLRLAGRSFKVGSVRLIQDKVDPEVWTDMASWSKALLAEYGVSRPMVIATGGNINQLQKLSNGPSRSPMSLEKLADLHGQLESLSYTERMDQFGLKPDRADVIVPAGSIYLRVMNLVDSPALVVPKVGLGDGMVLQLHQRGAAEKQSDKS